MPDRGVCAGSIWIFRRGETTHCLVAKAVGKSVTSLTAMGCLPKDALEVSGRVRLIWKDRDYPRANLTQMPALRARRIAIDFPKTD